MTLTISTDASSALETKIEQGAPADVFLSADTTNPKKLVDKGLTVGPAVNFADNKLTVIVPIDEPGQDHDPRGPREAGRQDHRRGRRRADHEVREPAGREPRQAARLSGQLSSRHTTPNIVSKEDNVKALVAKLELGEGDAGIVYVTDAKASTKVATVDVPDVGQRHRDLRRRRRQGITERSGRRRRS